MSYVIRGAMLFGWYKKPGVEPDMHETVQNWEVPARFVMAEVSS